MSNTGRPRNENGPNYPLRLAVPISLDIQSRLTEQAEAMALPKTTLARKLIVDGLKRAVA